MYALQNTVYYIYVYIDSFLSCGLIEISNLI